MAQKLLLVLELMKLSAKKEFRKRYTDEWLNKWKNKVTHGQFVRDMPETSDVEQTWNWPDSYPCSSGTGFKD